MRVYIAGGEGMSIQQTLLKFKKNLSKGELRKKEIILATIHCINTVGIEKTTLDAIGKQIGIGKAHVAYHFESKETIVLAAIDYISNHARDVVIESINKCTDIQKTIWYYIKAHMIWVKQNRDHAVVFTLFYYYCTYNPAYKKMNHAVRAQGHERISQMIKAIPGFKDKDSAELNSHATLLQQMILAACIDCITLDVDIELIFAQLEIQFKRYLGIAAPD
ncbi:MAG: TetR/AcrR family transcriptional regulator [Bdellovibrionaceae bacterium]|nr:TetR/AcrR family transcriptional regulator [Pseudobdellovibrionaceae bacterium]